MAREILEKIPPRSIEAEKALLGSLMLNPDSVNKVIDYVEASDFYQRAHQEIYQVCQELFEKAEPIDLLSVTNRLKEKELLDSVGGNSYLTELINTVPTAAHILSYADIVRGKKVLRDLIDTGTEVAVLGYNEFESPEKLLDEAESRIFSISQKGLRHKFIRIKDELEEAFNRIDRLSKYKGELRGLPTGFTNLDNILAGLQKSDLIILASRPSMGKSALAMNIASHVAINEKKSVAFFSLEMSKDQLVDRLIADQAGIDLWRLRTGKLSSDGDENDFTKIQHALGVLSEVPIYVDDSSFSNILQMRAMSRRLQAKEGLDLIIVDYLQLIEPRNSQVPMVQQMTEISRSLKSLAKEINVPVLAVSQLSRAVEQRTPQRPRLSDLRETGAIEQDADVVLFIYREDRYRSDTERKNIAEIIIAKHRNGPVGSIELYFDESRVAFRNLEK
ncbi:MAG: replicative DNA helicase, partial [bacterium]|nr:replicative DNA helicase [bacterium]